MIKGVIANITFEQLEDISSRWKSVSTFLVCDLPNNRESLVESLRCVLAQGARDSCKCNVCDLEGDLIRCSQCQVGFHAKCVIHPPRASSRSKIWFCDDCKSDPRTSTIKLPMSLFSEAKAPKKSKTKILHPICVTNIEGFFFEEFKGDFRVAQTARLAPPPIADDDDDDDDDDDSYIHRKKRGRPRRDDEEEVVNSSKKKKKKTKNDDSSELSILAKSVMPMATVFNDDSMTVSLKAWRSRSGLAPHVLCFPKFRKRLRKAKKKVEKAERAMLRKLQHEQEEEEIEIDDWIQCDKCQKWRRVPQSIRIPNRKNWDCSMNTWNKKQANCRVREEHYDEAEFIDPEELSSFEAFNINLKSFFSKCAKQFPKKSSQFQEYEKMNHSFKKCKIEGRHIEMCKLFELVMENGGFNAISDSNQWFVIVEGLFKKAFRRNAEQRIRDIYSRYLFEYEVAQTSQPVKKKRKRYR